MYGTNDYTLDKHYVLALRFGDFTRGDHLVEILLRVLPAGNLSNNWLTMFRASNSAWSLSNLRVSKHRGPLALLSRPRFAQERLPFRQCAAPALMLQGTGA